MAGTESQVLAVELEHVESKIPVLFDRDDTFFSQLDKTPVEQVSSVTARIPLELRPGGKSGHWNSDGGDLGTGDMPTYDKALESTVELIHRLQWTTRRKLGTDSTRKAVINAFRRDLSSGMQEFRRFNDSLSMTSGNGVLGTISVVSTAAGVDTYTLGTDGFGARLLRFGQDIDIWDATLTTKRTAAAPVTISFYDGPNKQIQALTTAGVVATDLIVAQGITSTPPVSINGVPYHASNASVGSWLGFNRATTPEIRANRVAAGGTLSLSQPRLALNKIGDRTGIKKRRKMQAWMHPCQQQSYEELGFEVSVVNKEAKEEGLDLYFNDNMQMAGAPVKKSYSWDKTRIDFIDLDAWKRFEFYPCGWYKDDNGNRYFVGRGASGGPSAVNFAYIVVSWNLFITNPAEAAYIDTLTVASGY